VIAEIDAAIMHSRAPAPVAEPGRPRPARSAAAMAPARN
jgi:hypothetical protein